MSEFTHEQKAEMYRKGEYQFKAPPVCTARWTHLSWINWIERNDGWLPAHTINQELVEKKADEIYQWIQDAVGDVTDCDTMDSKWQKRIKKAKKDGVTDIKGWLADEYYNDVDTLQDLCGDRIFDAATEIAGGPWGNPDHNEAFIAIANKMKERAHPALVTALDKLIERRSK